MKGRANGMQGKTAEYQRFRVQQGMRLGGGLRFAFPGYWLVLASVGFKVWDSVQVPRFTQQDLSLSKRIFEGEKAGQSSWGQGSGFRFKSSGLGFEIQRIGLVRATNARTRYSTTNEQPGNKWKPPIRVQGCGLLGFRAVCFEFRVQCLRCRAGLGFRFQVLSIRVCLFCSGV